MLTATAQSVHGNSHVGKFLRSTDVGARSGLQRATGRMAINDAFGSRQTRVASGSAVDEVGRTALNKARFRPRPRNYGATTRRSCLSRPAQLPSQDCRISPAADEPALPVPICRCTLAGTQETCAVDPGNGTRTSCCLCDLQGKKPCAAVARTRQSLSAAEEKPQDITSTLNQCGRFPGRPAVYVCTVQVYLSIQAALKQFRLSGCAWRLPWAQGQDFVSPPFGSPSL